MSSIARAIMRLSPIEKVRRPAVAISAIDGVIGTGR
jgi:hypothetical protein